MNSTNPFEILENRLSTIENLLIDIKHKTLDFNKIGNEFSDLPELLSRRQAAEIIGVSLGTLDAWSREGRITKHRNGSVVRFKKSELLATFKSLKNRKHSRAANKIGQ